MRLINGINHEWVNAMKRLSPQVLTEVFELGSRDLAAFVEALPLEAPALFGVSWAGEQSSDGWFDIGREFTELWHHQMQIRLAVGAAPLDDPRYLKAVLDLSVRALPHAYRDVAAGEGTTLVVEVEGTSGGMWTLTRDADRWTLSTGGLDHPDARVVMSDDRAWRLLYNALPAAEAAARIAIEGRGDLVAPLLRTRSIVI